MPQVYKSKAQREAIRVWNEAGRPFPVLVDEIIRQHGIGLQESVLEDSVSGMMITRENGTTVVAINQSHHENRKRFSMAHELGHYVLHRTTRSIFVDSSEQKFYRDAEASTGTKLQEIEANAFAAELLMPREKIEEFLPEKLNYLDEGVIERLADEFKVSQSAMIFRLQKLNLLEE